MTSSDIIIGGLRGEDLAAFILMLENGSTLESIQDEFGFSQSELKDLAETAREKANQVGGLGRLKALVESQAAPQDSSPKRESASSISKTSIGLRCALFKTMEDLIAGRMEASDAMAVCGISKAICDTVKLEMDAERLMAATKNGGGGPRMLRLGEVADK